MKEGITDHPRPLPSASGDTSGDTSDLVLRLYIANETVASARALTNMKIICADYLSAQIRLEIVDILREPLRALSEGVLMTPTLVKLSPPPVRRIVGDLSDTTAVLEILGVKAGS